MMFATTAKEFALSVPAPANGLRTLQLATRRLDAKTAVVAVDGEIDASNVDAVNDYVAAAAVPGQRLVLDTTSVEFCAIEGISILQAIDARCSADGVTWVLVPSPAVARVLRVCDPQGGLPTAVTAEAALAEVAGRGRRPLSLVAR